MIGSLLKDLGLTQTNAGTWSGVGGWLDDASAKVIESVNPATGQVIASVLATTSAQYEQMMASAREVALAWRSVPAGGASSPRGAWPSFPRPAVSSATP